MTRHLKQSKYFSLFTSLSLKGLIASLRTEGIERARKLKKSVMSYGVRFVSGVKQVNRNSIKQIISRLANNFRNADKRRQVLQSFETNLLSVSNSRKVYLTAFAIMLLMLFSGMSLDSTQASTIFTFTPEPRLETLLSNTKLYKQGSDDAPIKIVLFQNLHTCSAAQVHNSVLSLYHRYPDQIQITYIPIPAEEKVEIVVDTTYLLEQGRSDKFWYVLDQYFSGTEICTTDQTSDCLPAETTISSETKNQIEEYKTITETLQIENKPTIFINDFRLNELTDIYYAVDYLLNHAS